MAHRNLLIGMAALLAATAGGVFVLLNSDEKGREIRQEALIAGVEQVVEESIEPQIQTVQPKPKQVSTQKSASPTPQATPEPPSLPQPIPPSVGGPEPELDPPQEISPSVPAPAPQPESKPAAKVNINTAGLDELDQITGVGPAIAQRIIDYRITVSLFYAIEDIKNVKGIGDVTFEKMKGEITVGGISSPPPPPPQPAPAPQPEPGKAGKININTAGYEELQEITGVGEVIAQRIIDYRNQNGQFQTIEHIKEVKGIGDATFEKMKDQITI